MVSVRRADVADAGRVLTATPVFLLPFLVLICSVIIPTRGITETVDLRWSVPEDQYLRYERVDDDGHFDVFGYELTGTDHPVPDPGLVSPMSNLPEYLSLFLPHRKVSIGDSFQYRRKLTPDLDHRFYPINRWVPDDVHVTGRLERTEEQNGRTVHVLRQKIEARMTQEHLSTLRSKYRKGPVGWRFFGNARMEVRLWFDAGAGFIRKIQYSADATFPALKGTNTSKDARTINEQCTYRLASRHDIGGTVRGKTLEPRVRDATERGLQFLRSTRGDDGTWRNDRDYPRQPQYTDGETALVVYTLRTCGTNQDRNRVEENLDRLLDRTPRRTYTIALTLMALAAGESAPTDEQRKRAKRHLDALVRSMNENGGWQYHIGHSGSDHSTNQYAMLGLHAAGRLGFDVPVDVWKRALRKWLHTQAPKGHDVSLDLRRFGRRGDVRSTARARGWMSVGQAVPESGSGSLVYGALRSVRLPMVAGGIGSIRIALRHLAERRRLTDDVRVAGREAARDGWAWMQSHWSLRPYPSPRGWKAGWTLWQYYTLYALERAGSLTRTERVGTHGWYREGAELVLSRQNDQGAWGERNRVIPTCFALLFLNRVTSPLYVPREPHGGE